MMSRRYDIDWLRVIAIGLLLIYHIAIGFQPWGVFIRFIQNDEMMEGLWTPMSMLNVWRIPLLFFVSGMGVYFAIQKRNWKQLIGERSKRILLPLIFGMLTFVPLFIVVFQSYYEVDLTYEVDPGHLWFLGNIFCYVLILAPIFFYLKRNEGGMVQQWLCWVFSNPLTLLIVLLPFAAEAYIVNPGAFEMYFMNWHGFYLGLLAFFFGFLFNYSGENFWKTILKWRWMYLGLAVALYSVRFFMFNMKTPNMVMSVESNMWILAVFGFGYKYLNHPSKALTYLSQAAYPVYIVHMAVLYLASYWIFPMHLPVTIKFVSVVVLTFVGCFGLYEIIRRINWLRPLFGLNLSSKKKGAISKDNLAYETVPSSN